jgi:small subunit ribosomal protein S21
MLIIETTGRSLDSALKLLKNKFSKTKVIKELRERKAFKRKGEKRRDEMLKAKYIANKNPSQD